MIECFASARRRDAAGPAGETPAFRLRYMNVFTRNAQQAERNAGVLAGWPGGVPPPRSRETRQFSVSSNGATGLNPSISPFHERR